MQLHYRGSSYTVNHTEIETLETNLVARFLGRMYQVRHSLSPTSSQLDRPLTYRGIAYSNNYPLTRSNCGSSEAGLLCLRDNRQGMKI
jgi:Domain of unknown function (DUF4278)